MTKAELVNLLLACLGFLLAGISGWFVLEFRALRTSVDKLNLAIAEILGRIDHHHERIEKIEDHLEI